MKKLKIILCVFTVMCGLMMTGCTEEAARTVADIAETLIEEAATDTEETAGDAEETTGDTEEISVDAGEYQTYRFRSEKQQHQHYEKHGAEFGDITEEEYVQMANDLLNSDSDSILTKREKEDNDYVYYDQDTNEFLILSTDGYIRTFFKPSAGIKYFNRQ